MSLIPELSGLSRLGVTFALGLIVATTVTVLLGNPIREGILIGIGCGVGLAAMELYTRRNGTASSND